MVNCTFCGKEIPKGTGLMFIKKDAKILHFCSRKCEKNALVLKRKARNLPWTAEAQREKALLKHAAAVHEKEAKEAKKVKKTKETNKKEKKELKK